MPLLTKLNLSMKLKASEILSQLSGALLSSMSKSDVPSTLTSSLERG